MQVELSHRQEAIGTRIADLPSMEGQAPIEIPTNAERLVQAEFHTPVEGDLPGDEQPPLWPAVVVGGAFFATALWAGLLAWIATSAIMDWN
jgi:hypothetical protein